ncbi:hypothetical protein [Dokdonia sp.]|uniref:hypothetical protein n=1 Tax=Dokdonia sp. TaxID=2024995 RepID=UPI0032662C78
MCLISNVKGKPVTILRVKNIDFKGERAVFMNSNITTIAPSSNSVDVTAKLDIQPSNDKNMNGWITAIVIADVAE